jgi:GntR family transcriptional repressor for pyruvate dehydrogenase complex
MSILSGNTILPLIYNSFRTSNRNLFERHIRLYGVKLTIDFMTQLFNLIAKGETEEAISYLTNYYERSIKGDLEIYSE